MRAIAFSPLRPAAASGRRQAAAVRPSSSAVSSPPWDGTGSNRSAGGSISSASGPVRCCNGLYWRSCGAAHVFSSFIPGLAGAAVCWLTLRRSAPKLSIARRRLAESARRQRLTWARHSCIGRNTALEPRMSRSDVVSAAATAAPFAAGYLAADSVCYSIVRQFIG